MKHGMIALGAAALLLLAGCSGTGSPAASGSSGSGSAEPESVPAVTALTPEEAKAMMDEGGVTVVDVRTADEYVSGHVSGAVNIDSAEISDTPPAELPDKDAAILVYCRSGRRSAAAAQALADMGYTQIYDFGGIQNWPYETVKE